MNTLDTRDLYKRQCELESLRDALTEAQEALDAHKATPRPVDGTDTDDDMQDAYDEETDDLQAAVESAQEDFGGDEMQELEEIENIEGYAADFTHGTEMIPIRDFEEYAEELASEIGAIDRDAKWPLSHIDWKAAAEELAQDYTEVSYLGIDYYVRS